MIVGWNGSFITSSSKMLGIVYNPSHRAGVERSELTMKINIGNLIMKIRGEKFEQMSVAMRTWIDYQGGNDAVADVFNEGYRKFPESVSDVVNYAGWFVWNRVVHDLQHDDTHPAYVNGRIRIVPYVGWKYDNDLLDSHIQTAIRKIIKEVGLAEKLEKVA